MSLVFDISTLKRLPRSLCLTLLSSSDSMPAAVSAPDLAAVTAEVVGEVDACETMAALVRYLRLVSVVSVGLCVLVFVVCPFPVFFYTGFALRCLSHCNRRLAP